MGLSPELQGYAENIWRRFPEVFISLGSPDVEDVFELHGEGKWSHRVIDTTSEKVIEIVLCRRDPVRGANGSERVDVKSNEDLEYVCDGEFIQLDEDSLHTEIDKLSQAIAHLGDRLEECSMIEVPEESTQLELSSESWQNSHSEHNRIQPLEKLCRTEPSSNNEKSHSERTCSQSPGDCKVPEPSVMENATSGALEKNPPVVPPSRFTVSALASRRGLNLFPVNTQRLSPHLGPHCVQRLDTPAKNDGLGSHRSRAPSRNNSNVSSPLCSRMPPAHPFQQEDISSPGTQIQHRAIQRRQASGSSRATTRGESYRSAWPHSSGDSIHKEDVMYGFGVPAHGARPALIPAGMHQGCSPVPCHLRSVAPVTQAATGALAAVGRSQETCSPVLRSIWHPAASSLQTVGSFAATFQQPCQKPPLWNSNW